jgi:hypothetical protein
MAAWSLAVDPESEATFRWFVATPFEFSMDADGAVTGITRTAQRVN